MESCLPLGFLLRCDVVNMIAVDMCRRGEVVKIYKFVFGSWVLGHEARPGLKVPLSRLRCKSELADPSQTCM